MHVTSTDRDRQHLRLARALVLDFSLGRAIFVIARENPVIDSCDHSCHHTDILMYLRLAWYVI